MVLKHRPLLNTQGSVRVDYRHFTTILLYPINIIAYTPLTDIVAFSWWFFPFTRQTKNPIFIIFV